MGLSSSGRRMSSYRQRCPSVFIPLLNAAVTGGSPRRSDDRAALTHNTKTSHHQSLHYCRRLGRIISRIHGLAKGILQPDIVCNSTIPAHVPICVPQEATEFDRRLPLICLWDKEPLKQNQNMILKNIIMRVTDSKRRRCPRITLPSLRQQNVFITFSTVAFYTRNSQIFGLEQELRIRCSRNNMLNIPHAPVRREQGEGAVTTTVLLLCDII